MPGRASIWSSATRAQCASSASTTIRFTTRPATGYNVGFPRQGLWQLRLNSDWKGYSIDFDGNFAGDVEAHSDPYDGLCARGTLDIAPYSVLIFSQDPT